MSAAGGRDDVVQPQIERHLAIVVGAMPNDDGGQAEASIRAGVGPLDRLIHVLRGDGAERLADRREGVAQIDEKFFLGACRAWSAFVTCVRRLLPVELGSESKI